MPGRGEHADRGTLVDQQVARDCVGESRADVRDQPHAEVDVRERRARGRDWTRADDHARGAQLDVRVAAPELAREPPRRGRRAVVEHAGLGEHERAGAGGRERDPVDCSGEPAAQTARGRRRERVGQRRGRDSAQARHHEHVEPRQRAVVADARVAGERQAASGRDACRRPEHAQFDRSDRAVDRAAHALGGAQHVQQRDEARVEAPGQHGESNPHVADRSA
ncbi:MAG TPA: hypothetical protein VFG31_03180 [Conexibacter sp.]|nr:hypothetical protein [Conexibacter sp.]